MSVINNNTLNTDKAKQMLESQNIFQMTEALEWLVKNPDSYADVEICQHLGVLIANTALHSLGEGANPTEKDAERIGFYLELSKTFETSVKNRIRELEKETETLKGRVTDLTREKNHAVTENWGSKQEIFDLGMQIFVLEKTQKKELKEKNEELSTLTKNLEETREALNFANHQLGKLDDELELQKNSLEGKNSELSQVKQTLQETQRNLNLEEENVNRLQEFLVEVTASEEKLQNEKNELTNKLDTKTKEANLLSTQLSQAKTSAEQAAQTSSQQLANAQREVETQSSKVKQLQGQLEQSQKNEASLRQSEFETKTKFEHLQVEKTHSDSQANQLKNELGTLKTIHQSTLDALSNAEKQTEDLQTQIGKLKAELAFNESTLQGKNNQERLQLKSEIEQLEKAKGKLEAEVQTLRDNLRAVENSAKKNQEALELANRTLEETKSKFESILQTQKANQENEISTLTKSVELATELHEARNAELEARNAELRAQATNQQAEIQRLQAEVANLKIENANQKTLIDVLKDTIGRLEDLVVRLGKALTQFMDYVFGPQAELTFLERAKQKKELLANIQANEQGLIDLEDEAVVIIKAKAEAEAQAKQAEEEARTTFVRNLVTDVITNSKNQANDIIAARTKEELEAKEKMEALAAAKKEAEKAEKSQRKLARRAKANRAKLVEAKNQEAVPLLSAEEKAEAKMLKQILGAPAQNPVRLSGSVEIEPLDEVELIPQTRGEFHAEAKLKLDTTVEQLSEFEESFNQVIRKYEENELPLQFLGVQATIRSFDTQLSSINDELQTFLIDSWKSLNAEDTEFKRKFEELLSKTTQYMSKNKPKIEQLEKKLNEKASATQEPEEVKSVFSTLSSYLFGWGKQA